MPTTLVTLVAAAVVFVLWLVISFLPPGRRRISLEWFATTALFLALGAWFIGLVQKQHAAGHIWLLVLFGFLTFVFCSGLCVSAWRTVAHLRGRTSSTESPTH